MAALVGEKRCMSTTLLTAEEEAISGEALSVAQLALNLGNGGSWSLIDALGVSTTWRETRQTYEFMPSLFLLANTVNLNQSTPNSFYP